VTEDATAVLARIVESATGVDLRGGGSGERSVTLVGRDGEKGPVERLPSLLTDARSVVGVVPRIESALADRLTAADAPADARIVLTGRAGERLTGPARPAIRSALAGHGVDLYTHQGDSPVGVLLVDDHAVVGLFDGPTLAAVLTTDHPSVREWAAATFQRYREAADAV
jgi:hypothetical protein